MDANNYFMNASSTDPIEMSIMGKEYQVWGSAANQLTVTTGTEVSMSTSGAGYTEPTTGKAVKLVQVGTSAKVSVDGQERVIDDGQTRTINGLRVKIDDIFRDSDSASTGSATVTVGVDEVSKTYTNGDYFIGYKDGDSTDLCEEDSAAPICWKWEISGLDGSAPSLNVTLNYAFDKKDRVIYLGDSL